jgi:adenylate kinase family enzyme
MTPRGRFITLEGIEGAGKSTVAAALAAALRAHGLTVVATREPGGTPLAERLREVVLQRGTERIAPEAETLLMFAARAVHVENLIRPALVGGNQFSQLKHADGGTLSAILVPRPQLPQPPLADALHRFFAFFLYANRHPREF